VPRATEHVIPLEKLKRLGPELRVSTDPAYGELSLNRVPVTNPWVGRLPIGRQILHASLTGEATVTQVLNVTPNTPHDIVVKLDIEARAAALGDKKRRSIEFVPALLMGTTLGSEAEETCAQAHCTDNSAAWGTLSSARLGYRFVEHITFELSAGLLYLTKTQQRRFSDSDLPEFDPVSYNISDKLRVRGPFVSAGLAFEKRLKSFGLGGRLHLGASHAFARHRTEGTMSTGEETERVRVSHSNTVQRSSLLMGLPELFVTYHRSAWQLGAGVGALVIMTRAPVSRHGEIWPEVRDPGPCDSIRCAPPSEQIARERAYGPSAQASISLYGGLRF
jgi:hypothetical protein